MPLSDIVELDESYWFGQREQEPTTRAIAEHLKLVNASDLAYPIILCSGGRVMNGMHRVVRAYCENRTTIKAVQFHPTPEPDFVNVGFADLPYDD